jgi:hypothetical protein
VSVAGGPLGACATRSSARSSATGRVEETAMRIFEFAQLRDHGGDHIRMGMAKARNGRAAGGVDAFLAVRVLDQNSLPADRNGVIVTDLSVKDVRHRRVFRRGSSLDIKCPQPRQNVVPRDSLRLATSASGA